MATRKMKRYEDGGDVLGRLMGGMNETDADRAPRMQPENPINPDEPMSRGDDNSGKMAQVIKSMSGSNRGNAGDGISLGQRMGTADERMGNAGDGISAMGVSDAQTALQGMAAKKAAKDAMIESLISNSRKQPDRAKIKPSYGGMGGYAKGGSVSKASSRADGIAQRGKTRGKMC
jgi:hypothetical protein